MKQREDENFQLQKINDTIVLRICAEGLLNKYNAYRLLLLYCHRKYHFSRVWGERRYLLCVRQTSVLGYEPQE